MIRKYEEGLAGKELKILSIISVCALVIIAFMLGEPITLWEGLKKIIVSRDALITDYFELAGYGATFLNAALICAVALVLLFKQKVAFTGITMSTLFINLGYAFWGKNLINILPILFGTFLYAKLHRTSFSRYIYTALLGTCLSPLVTEMAYILPFSQIVNIIIATVVGIFAGFVLPPLTMHTVSIHMGYSLFNVGFSAGILVFVVVCILKCIGMESDTVLIWAEGRPLPIIIGLSIYFAFVFLLGLFLNKGNIKKLFRIVRHPGRAVADFVIMEGVGTTLMNMALVGYICIIYICLIGGDFSGPVVGAIFTAFGFAAFGVHVKNFIPVLIGVCLSGFFTQFQATTPGIQLAAIFAVGLAPIAGQFGIISGIIAGILHAIISTCTSDLYGGLNLYNCGFSAGWVAFIMVPVIESFMTRFKDKRRRA